MLRYEAQLSSDVARLMRLLTSAHPTIVCESGGQEAKDDALDFIINYDIKYRMGRDAEENE